MALDLKHSKHKQACDILCACCLKKVTTIKVLSGSIPDEGHSRALTPYICNLAVIRWQVTWEVGSTIFPNRICTNCRLTLMLTPQDVVCPRQLNSPSRQHTLLTTWIPGECSLCDTAFARGRKKKRKYTGCPKKIIQDTFVLICKNCGVESTRKESFEHKYTTKEAKVNLINLIENSKVSSLALASRIIRDNSNPGSSMMVPTEGRRIKIQVGSQAKPIISLTAEDILKQEADMRWSARQSAENVKMLRNHLKTQNVTVKFAGQNAVKKIVKVRTEDLITETIINGNKGSELNPILCDINTVYCNDVKCLARRISTFRKKVVDWVKIQGDHGQGSFKLSAQLTFSNSVNNLQILAVTQESGESIMTIKSIIELVKPEDLEDIGARVIYTGDLQFLQLLLCIKTGNASYPCPWCNWRMTGPLRDPVELSCEARNIERDVEKYIQLGELRSKSHLCHGQQNIPAKNIIKIDPRESLVPPVLHIKLGLINEKCTALEKIYGYEYVLTELYSKARVSKKRYQGGTLEGNECNRVVKTYVDINWDESHPLEQYKTLFEMYSNMSVQAFTIRKNLSEDDLINISVSITEYIMTWQNMAPILKLTEPLKLHTLIHVLEYCIKFKCTPANFSEQDGESLHRVFKKDLEHFKTQGNKALKAAVKKFNATNF